MRFETAGIIILLTLICVLLIYSIGKQLSKFSNTLRIASSEAFENRERYNKKITLMDKPEDFYDDFYVQRIHQAYYPDSKNVCRCSDLYKSAYLRLYPKHKTRTLLVGANTGRFLDAVCGICPEVTGITRYPKLKDVADRMAPKARVLLGDAAHNDDLFPEGLFTHVIFEDRALYEYKSHNERRAAIKNSIKWLEPGGRLILRIVDPDKFDPMIPTSVPLRGLNIQNYLKNRKRDSKVYFKDGSRIETNFTQIPSEEKSVFREDLYDKSGSFIRTHVHRWTMPGRDIILEEVAGMGLEHDQTLSLAPCVAPYESYEIFVKPEYKFAITDT